MAKLTSKTNFNATPAAGDVCHLVDISDTTDDPNGSSFKVTVEDLTKRGLTRTLRVRVVEADTEIVTGTGLGHRIRIPYNCTMTDIVAYVGVVGSGTGNTTIDVNIEGGASIMTTDKCVIEQGEDSTETAVTQPALTTTSFTLNQYLVIDVDGVEATNPPQGLTIDFTIVETY